MVLPGDRGDREYQKFEETTDGEVAVRITASATSPVNVLNVLDQIATNGIYGPKSVSTTPVLGCVGVGNKVARTQLVVTPTDGQIFWGFDAAVTILTGTPIAQNLTAIFASPDTVTIYLVAASAVDVRLVEI